MDIRLVLTGTAVAAAIAGTVVGVAVASPGNSSAGSFATSSDGPAKASASASTPVVPATSDPQIVAAAHELGVTPQALLDALPAAKQAAGNSMSDEAAAAAVAARLGVSTSAAQAALSHLFGSDPGPTKTGAAIGPDTNVISHLASSLGVSEAKARQVWDQLNALSDPGHGIDPTSSGYRQLAASLGKTPDQLSALLRQFKESFRPSGPSAAPSAS
jgi:hypothetical protein